MSVKNFREGLRLVPVSADPINPEEGQLQYSDGTSRPEGIYVFSNGEWTTVGSDSGNMDPETVTLVNPTFDGDTQGWTFTPDVNAPQHVFESSTVDPITGNASGLVGLDLTGYTSNQTRTSTLSTTFSLAGTLQEQSDRIKIEFDISGELFTTTFVNFQVLLRIREAVTNVPVFVSGILSTDSGQLPGELDLSHVDVTFDRISSETEYVLTLEFAEFDNQ